MGSHSLVLVLLVVIADCSLICLVPRYSRCPGSDAITCRIRGLVWSFTVCTAQFGVLAFPSLDVASIAGVVLGIMFLSAQPAHGFSLTSLPVVSIVLALGALIPSSD